MNDNMSFISLSPESKIEKLDRSMNYEVLWFSLKEELLKDRTECTPTDIIVKMAELEAIMNKAPHFIQIDYSKQPEEIK